MRKETKKCKFCQTEIDAKAKVCPNCKRTLKRPGCLIGVIAFLLIGASVTFSAVYLSEYIDKTNVTNGSNIADNAKNNVTAVENTQSRSNDNIQVISIGDTISTRDFDFTLNNVELSYDVLPDNTSGFYTHYAADSGNVYIHIDADIKNTAKQNLDCEKIYSVKATYDNQYTYNGFSMVDDTTTGFTYANITDIMPLSTLGVHNLVKCPQEIETSTAPLYITIEMNDGAQYRFNIR